MEKNPYWSLAGCTATGCLESTISDFYLQIKAKRGGGKMIIILFSHKYITIPLLHMRAFVQNGHFSRETTCDGKFACGAFRFMHLLFI